MTLAVKVALNPNTTNSYDTGCSSSYDADGPALYDAECSFI